MSKVSSYISSRMKELGLDQKDLALQAQMQFQNVSAILSDKRKLTVKQSIVFDDILQLNKGFLLNLQCSDEVINCNINVLPSVAKHEILVRIKDNGGLWSYENVPDSFTDDDIIEEGLRYLEFEEMHLLFELWSSSHIKRIWKERLIPEGKRLNVLNKLLGMIFFNIDRKQINKYLTKYGNR